MQQHGSIRGISFVLLMDVYSNMLEICCI